MKTPSLIRTVLILLALAVLAGGIAAQKKKPRVPKTITATVTVSASNPSPEQRRQEAFIAAWSTLNQNYFDKTFSGLDWNKIRTEFQPRVDRARTDVQFHRILEEMLGRLGKSHLNIITPEYFGNIENAKKQSRLKGKQIAAARRAESGSTSGDADMESDEDFFEDSRYGIGVELRMLDDRIVITHVEKQSGATMAGLKPGLVIEKVNGVSLSDLIRQSLLDGNSAAEVRYMLPIQIVDSFLNGEPDTSVFLTCLDENDKPKEFTVPRLALAGESITISKNLPEQFLRYEARSLNADIGYIKFSAFSIPVIAKFCDSLSEFRDKKALIIDLRGNLGGILSSMIGLSGMVTEKQLKLGTFVSRAKREDFIVDGKNKNFKGKIVILVDGLSMSATELFTAGLQGNKRVVVVGDRTGGQSLPAVWTRLSTGAVMLYPVADFITPKGISLEGLGLQPDHPVTLDRKALLNGVDTQLEKAIAIIADGSAFPVPPEVKGTGTASTAPQPATTVPSDAQVSRSADASADSPPPPPPRITVTGDGHAPPPPPIALLPKPKPGPSDGASLKVIADFTAATGGTEALKVVASYEAKGTMTLSQDGDSEANIYAAREFPDKFLMVVSTPAMGEIREIYNGKNSLLQADFGINRNLYPGLDTTRVHLLSPVFNAMDLDYLRGMKHEGEFAIEGRKRHIISATSPEGLSVGLSFDSVTKMLVTFALPGVLYTIGDYRKTDGIMLPFTIDTDVGMNIRLESITFNRKLEPGTFEKVEKCYDKAN